MKKLLLILLALPLFGASILIDCGSSSDTFFSGGTAYAIANGLGDTTLRYFALPFSYKIPVLEPGPYTVTLEFIEPTVHGNNQRLFSVKLNDQTVIDRLDLYATAGFLTPVRRSFLAYPAAGFIKLEFLTQIRSAVISSIRLEPFTQYVVPSDPRTVRVTEAAVVWWNDGYLAPRPAMLPDPTVPLGYTDVAVYKNGVRLRTENQAAAGRELILGVNFGQLKIIPVSGQPWPASDAITVDYTAILPPQFMPE